jgi:hypothetical protein
MSANGEKCREVVVERDRVRRPQGTAFGWIDARIKNDRWLGVLGPEAVAVYTFLCLAANHDGVSWYTRARMGGELDQRWRRTGPRSGRGSSSA